MRVFSHLTCSFLSGSYLRANPKSIILIRFPSRVKHMMFSGFRSRWIMLFRWTNSMAWQTCRKNTEQARSVSTKSSSITRSNSSPPSTLEHIVHLGALSEWEIWFFSGRGGVRGMEWRMDFGWWVGVSCEGGVYQMLTVKEVIRCERVGR